MATFRATIPYQKKTDKTSRVIIRVTHKRVQRFITTEIYVAKEDITKSGKVRSLGIQDEIDALVKSYRDRALGLGIAINAMSCDDVVGYLKKSTAADVDLDFFAYADDYTSKMLAAKMPSAKNYKSAINSLKRFISSDSILCRMHCVNGVYTLGFSQITAVFLSKYTKWLLASPSAKSDEKTIKIGGRAESLYLGTIAKLIKEAKKEHNDEDLEVVRIKANPFSKIKIKKPPLTRKRALSVEQLIAIRDVNLAGMRRAEFARNVFMMSFYSVGANSVDLYSLDAIKDGRVHYNRSKTKDRRQDHAEISIEVYPELQQLIEMYADGTRQRAFDFHRRYSDASNFNQALNIGLKQVGELVGVEDLEFYAARHTWATIATNEVLIDKYTVHTALNHVDESMRITDIYIKKDWSIIDKANRKVLDYILEYKKSS